MQYTVYLSSGPNTAIEEVVRVEADIVDVKEKLTSLYTAYPKKLVLAVPSYRLRLIVHEGAIVDSGFSEPEVDIPPVPNPEGFDEAGRRAALELAE